MNNPIFNGCRTEESHKIVKFLKEKGYKAKKFDNSAFANIDGILYQIFGNWNFNDYKEPYTFTMQEVDFDKYNDKYKNKMIKSLNVII